MATHGYALPDGDAPGPYGRRATVLGCSVPARWAGCSPIRRARDRRREEASAERATPRPTLPVGDGDQDAADLGTAVPARPARPAAYDLGGIVRARLPRIIAHGVATAGRSGSTWCRSGRTRNERSPTAPTSATRCSVPGRGGRRRSADQPSSRSTDQDCHRSSDTQILDGGGVASTRTFADHPYAAMTHTSAAKLATAVPAGPNVFILSRMVTPTPASQT